MKILLVDNYDSFTFNLLHYLEGFDVDVKVVRNDAIPFDELENFDKFVLSPGPGLPNEAGDMNLLIDKVVMHKPVLGVCLGFQALLEYFGGELYNQEIVKHGVSENCSFNIDSKLFRNLPPTFNIGLYHSWAIRSNSFPSELILSAELKNSTPMAFEHRELAICGLQFHPESILTEHGHKIVENFLCNFK